jgi:hypothetical protein
VDAVDEFAQKLYVEFCSKYGTNGGGPIDPEGLAALSYRLAEIFFEKAGERKRG